jgi:4-hydroxy-tetrahydrodipicolinate reductase
MNKVRVALVGAAGRMGKTLMALAPAEDVQIIAPFDSGDTIKAENVDVLIDFSSPEAAEAVCAEATKHNTPLVIGTTGHSAEQRYAIQLASGKIPIVLASNFSVGVNVLFSLTEQAAEILGENFHCEILEMHHEMKKDAPSGTARTLAEIVQKIRGGELRHGRKGILGERDKFEIGIHSVRGGDVVGDHTVIFAGKGERLELTHRATSRDTFARGALQAAHWIMGKTPRLYTMRDVLGQTTTLHA